MTEYMKRFGLRIFRNGYEVVPIEPGEKYPAPRLGDWRAVKLTEDRIRDWQTNGFAGHGVGIRTGKVMLLDIDAPTNKIADEIELEVELLIGQGLARYGAWPKRGLMFRTENPFRKMSTKEFYRPGRSGKKNKHQVEALGDGQQFVSHHTHPDTKKPYIWITGSPLTVHADDLPVITEEQVRKIIERSGAIFVAHGLRPKTSTGAEPSPSQREDYDDDDILAGATLRDIDDEKLRNLVMSIPNKDDDVPYEASGNLNVLAWLEMLMAIAHQTGKSEEGRQIAYDWSIQSSKHDDAEFEKTWKSVEKERGNRRPITAKYIAKWAKFYEEKNENRPEILVRAGYMHEITTEAESALIRFGAPLYCRGPIVVRPVIEEVDASHERKTKVARLTEVGANGLLDWMGRSAIWKQFDGRSKKPLRVDPPFRAAVTLLSRDGEWKIPPLAGVITTPTLRPDGTILSEPGYDPATRLLLVQPPPLPDIPEEPTKKQAMRCLRLYRDLLDEFPFVDEVSRSVALSILITPVIRGAIPNAPLHLARAPTAGTGKSYLMDIASAIAVGRPCPVITAGKTEEETEKRLGAILLSGQPICSIDNLNGELDGDQLCQIVERPRVQVRILGKSEMPTIESRTTIFATGNNLIVKGDMVRRTLVSELDTNLERPELRKFRSNPLDLILADRGRYVAAALTIARAYIAAGFPLDNSCQPLASFESWSRYVRSALVWLGCADPVDSIEKSRQDDPEIQAIRALVFAWRDAIGVGIDHGATAGELITRAAGQGDEDDYENDNNDSHLKLQDALSAIASARGGGISPVLLGRWLGRRKGRIVEGLKISAAWDSHKEATKWFLQSTG